MTLSIRPATVARRLTIIAAVLAVAHVVFFVLRYRYDRDYVMGLAPLFDFQLENTMPSYFSALLLMAAAGLIAVIGLALRDARRPWWRHWLGMSLVFVFLSCDEMLALHERLMFPVRNALGTSGLLYSAWVIPYGIAVLILGFIYLRFLLALYPKTRVRFLVAGALFMMGAVVLEVLSGAEWEQYQTRTLLLEGYILFEDLFEMAGVIVFIWALLHEIGREGIRIGVGGATVAGD